MQIRAARAADATQLTVLANAAKAHWGYSAATLRRWQSELSISTAAIAINPTFVAEESELLGFYMLGVSGDSWELEHLWVSPDRMRKGIGKLLVTHAASFVRAHGGKKLNIDADPNAEHFYIACGARRIGEIAAPIDEQPNRVRPILELDVSIP